MKKYAILSILVAILLTGTLLAQSEETTREPRGMRTEGNRPMRIESESSIDNSGRVRHNNMESINRGEVVNREGRMPLAHLNLTAEQEAAVESLRENNRRAMTSKREEHQRLITEQETAMNNGDFKQARKLTPKISKIEQDMRKLNIDLREQIFRLLTDEQKELMKNTRRPGRQ